MSENITVELDIPEAKVLADRVSITQDLEFCIKCCERLADLIQTGSDDSVLVQSLWTSALISYVRCFAYGKRYGLSEDIFLRFEGEPIAAHNFYKNLRDKNIAHSVNPFEQVKVGVVLSPTDSPKEILGVATLVLRHISADLVGVRQLGLLASTLRTEVGKLWQEAQEQVSLAARQVSIDKLYKSPPLRAYAPDSEQAGKPR